MARPARRRNYQADLTTASNFLLPYAAFRGWVWGNEWWTDSAGIRLYGIRDGTENQTEETNYQADVATAQSTGVWNSFIDTDRRPASGLLGEDAWTTFDSTPVMQNNPQLVTATAGEFRNPRLLAAVQLQHGRRESDLNAQWEQYKLPYDTTFGVDYYKRFATGQKGWLHPEIWNDTGTGEQILPSLSWDCCVSPMGWAVPPVPAATISSTAGSVPEDPRSAYNGTTSVYRAMNAGLLQALWAVDDHAEKNDRVAIVVSARQAEIDTWGQQLPSTIGRLLEAYLALLHCHYPAALVFTTDMTSTSLNGYKAVFLVDQWVELDGNSTGNTGGLLQTALTNAYNAGAKIFYDGDCKDVDNVFSTFGATALGMSFNQFESLPAETGNDYCYISYLNAIRNDEPAVTTALSSITPPATVGIDEVFTAESDEEQGRYIYVVNNITPTGNRSGGSVAK